MERNRISSKSKEKIIFSLLRKNIEHLYNFFSSYGVIHQNEIKEIRKEMKLKRESPVRLLVKLIAEKENNEKIESMELVVGVNDLIRYRGHLYYGISEDVLIICDKRHMITLAYESIIVHMRKRNLSLKNL
jgi:pyruvate kinase